MKFRILIVALFTFNFAFGQAEDCECATRSPIFSKEKFHLILSPQQAQTHRTVNILDFLVTSPLARVCNRAYAVTSKLRLYFYLNLLRTN